MAEKDPLKVITPVAIISFPNVAEPQRQTEQQIKAGQKPKYSSALIFVEGTNLAELRAAARAAAVSKWGEQIKLPNGKVITIDQAFEPQYDLLHSPFRTDALKKGYPEGSTYTNVRSDRKPQCVYRHKDPVTGKPAEVPADKIAETFYSGSRVKASLRAFPYDNSGNKGVSFALNNLQFWADGERLDNRAAAADEFTADLAESPADLSDLT